MGLVSGPCTAERIAFISEACGCLLWLSCSSGYDRLEGKTEAEGAGGSGAWRCCHCMYTGFNPLACYGQAARKGSISLSFSFPENAAFTIYPRGAHDTTYVLTWLPN